MVCPWALSMTMSASMVDELRFPVLREVFAVGRVQVKGARKRRGRVVANL